MADAARLPATPDQVPAMLAILGPQWSADRLAMYDAAALLAELASPRGAYRFWDGVVRDPQEAWEVLATRGVIPESWVQDLRRAFCDATTAVTHLDGGARVRVATPNGRAEERDVPAWQREGRSSAARMAATYGPVVLPHPASLADCVAFASDVPRVLAAECLARDVLPRERVLWQTLPGAEIRRWRGERNEGDVVMRVQTAAYAPVPELGVCRADHPALGPMRALDDLGFLYGGPLCTGDIVLFAPEFGA